MTWSNLPGLSRALSKQSGLFVAAITITSLLQTSSQSNCKGGKKTKTKKTVMQITANCSAATFKIHITRISNLLLSVDSLRSLRLQDLLCTPPLHGLQANSIHLIEKHGQEARLCAAGRLTR